VVSGIRHCHQFLVDVEQRTGVIELGIVGNELHRQRSDYEPESATTAEEVATYGSRSRTTDPAERAKRCPPAVLWAS
jgi:hypothetical protein